MGLKITKAHEIIETKTITACVYGAPGLGKSTLGFTADAPLVFDFDKGSHRTRNRRDTVQVESWKDVLDVKAEDLVGYKTIVVDTAGRALDAISAHIIGSNPKMGRGGALTLQGFGELRTLFIAWTKLIRSFGLDVVLLAHMDEQRDGDEMRERLDIQGSSKGEIYKAADAMGRVYMANGKRWLNFSPSDTAFGKNPGMLPPLEVPHYEKDPNFLGGVIGDIKAKLNEMTAAQVEVVKLTQEWEGLISALDSAEDFNERLPAAKESDERIRPVVKRLLLDAALAKGCTFDKDKGIFVAPEAPKEEPKKGRGKAKAEPEERQPGEEG